MLKHIFSISSSGYNRFVKVIRSSDSKSTESWSWKLVILGEIYVALRALKLIEQLGHQGATRERNPYLNNQDASRSLTNLVEIAPS